VIEARDGRMLAEFVPAVHAGLSACRTSSRGDQAGRCLLVPPYTVVHDAW